MPRWLSTFDILLLAMAPFIGSFLGVLVRRLPLGRRIVLGRSACEACGHTLAAIDLVPIASYILLRGRCRFCRSLIEREHLVIEVACLVIAALSIALEGDDWPRAAADCVLGWPLLALAWIDRAHFRLPDALTLPLLLLGLLCTALLQPEAIADHAIAAITAYIGFRCIASAYRWLRNREGLGQGDAKLLAASGAWIGIAGLPYVLLVGALLGLAIAVADALRGRGIHAQIAIPFGPCLAAATWVAWLSSGRG